MLLKSLPQNAKPVHMSPTGPFCLKGGYITTIIFPGLTTALTAESHVIIMWQEGSMINMLLYSKDLYSPSLHQSWLLHLISLRSWKQLVWTIHRFILFYFLSLKVILYSWMLYYVYAVDISAGICWLTWLPCLLILTIISNEAWSTCWLDSRWPICWHIYIYAWVLLVHKIQEIYGYALLV